MTNFKIVLEQGGHKFETLKDILPDGSGKLEILFIAKTPTPKSVEAGHYFQGRQGKMFWNRLKEYAILQIKPGTFEDENLLDNRFGLTDIVKRPRDFGDEPSEHEYRNGLDRIMAQINKHQPKVVVFVYKRVLDNILRLGHGPGEKSVYGLNNGLKRHFNSEVFVFPMPGTPCTSDQSIKAMNELKQLTAL